MSIHLNALREEHSSDNVAYIRQMLGELRQVASGEGADMLCYLIEMAYVEASDILTGRRPRSITDGNRHKPTGMPI